MLYLRRSYFFNMKTSINTDGEKTYESYSVCEVGGPDVCCICCAATVRNWLNNKGRSVTFALPMLWREPTDHLTESHFYSSATSARNYKEKKRPVNYPNISSAIRPVPHTEDPPFPVPPQQYSSDSDDEPTEHHKTPQPSTSTDADRTVDL